MPPRYTYWTIIAGGLPTAFRAADRDELLPTFQRIKDKHPDAEMRWFARGKLWESPEEARAADRRKDSRGPSRSFDRREGAAAEHGVRGRDWRPGGAHRDPRQKFKDAQKQRNADHRQQRWQRKHAADSTHRPPPSPREPNREPRPGEAPPPTPPPRPAEPIVPSPGPPEQGNKKPSRRPFRPSGGFRPSEQGGKKPSRPFRPSGGFRKGPRR